MKSSNTKGNPYHDEEGKFTSGDNGAGSKTEKSTNVKLKDGIDISNFFNALGAIQKTTTPLAQTQDLSSKIISKNLKVPSLAKNLKKSFEYGTPEAQKIVSDFYEFSGIEIKNGDACYSIRMTMFLGSPMGNASSIILLRDKDLKDYKKGETFYHETFHGIDTEYWDKKTKKGCICCNYRLQSGITMQDTFHNEIANNKYAYNRKLYDDIKQSYDNSLIAELSKQYPQDQALDIAKKVVPEYFESLNRQFKAKKISYYDYQNEWNSANVLRKLVRPIIGIVDKKYAVMSDFCSFIYRSGISNSICGGHSRNYWNSDNGRKPIKEMFAEMGSAWSTNDTEQLGLFQKYFPETYKGFLEIVNNLENIKQLRKGHNN